MAGVGGDRVLCPTSSFRRRGIEALPVWIQSWNSAQRRKKRYYTMYYILFLDTKSLKSKTSIDANGIVIGEYGFLTADGYYQTVMYATDKEGRFLITGRKRVRVTPRKFNFIGYSNVKYHLCFLIAKPRPEVEGRQGRDNSDSPKITTTTTTTTERSKIYQFNYTALQHGRQEMGFSDSSKMGDYYWDGPDGYRRIVTYDAEDGKGYRPTIKQVKLPIQ